jgi:hypothetical protein
MSATDCVSAAAPAHETAAAAKADKPMIFGFMLSPRRPPHEAAQQRKMNHFPCLVDLLPTDGQLKLGCLE